MSKALFGAGCFWGIEEYFSKINGINNTAAGYSGGNTENPTYEEVCQGDTEHVEVVEINFDENIISYKNLLKHFWHCHDPTQLNRQGPDVGRQYRSAIFYYSDDQKNLAELSKKEKQNDFSNMIVTEIVEAKTFYTAEDYHQQFLKKRV
ncbi:peptide-methionine (S)-S-oxide reductase MsrA [Alphaproteobacteria bacterium]|nr:peptide-methionine (S)-S-oxide reductase MsrA [Alphaproteobacteria bacterium]